MSGNGRIRTGYRRPEEGRQGPCGGAKGDGLGEEDGRTWATIEALPGAHAAPYRLWLRGWLSGRVRRGMGALLTRGDALKISAGISDML